LYFSSKYYNAKLNDFALNGTNFDPFTSSHSRHVGIVIATIV